MGKIIRVTKEQIPKIAPLIADFRVALKSYKGIRAVPNRSAAAEEAAEYLDADFPIYAAVEETHFVGYLVCRVEKPCVWVESIYMRADGGALLRRCLRRQKSWRHPMDKKPSTTMCIPTTMA